MERPQEQEAAEQGMLSMEMHSIHIDASSDTFVKSAEAEEVSKGYNNLLDSLDDLTNSELKRLLVQHLTRQKLGLYWEHNLIERDRALSADYVFPNLSINENGNLNSFGHAPYPNLIIEGDNYDALRLLRSTHAQKIRVIYIDPPYNTGEKDWVYNDHYVGKNDRFRQSMWLEFLYRRLMLARELLTQDGVILVSINDENRAKLEMLMDEVFAGMHLGSFVWRSRTGGNDTGGAFLSINHEHVLVYGRPGFKFSGDEKSYSMYRFQEGNRLFRLSDLTKAHDLTERPNTYYPIHDPNTDIWYPCNPDRVWAYASRDRVKPGQKIRGNTMEELIAKNMIWFPKDQRIEVYPTLEDLLSAIDTGNVPQSGKTLLIRRDLPDLESWVGKKIGFGRPAYKRYKETLKNENQPISSWLTPKAEADTVPENTNMPIVGTTEEGAKQIKEVMGGKAFPYPKPLSLIKSLVAQASRPGDVILDFFAGSGTTAHAVLALNAEHLDDEPRRFILVSSREATTANPDNNLCRDVCAERVRRIMDAEINEGHQIDGFGYLRLHKLPPADVRYELKLEMAWHWLCLKHTGTIRPYPGAIIQAITESSETALLFCPQVTDECISLLVTYPGDKLVIYSDRPDSISSWVGRNRIVDSRSYLDEILGSLGG